MIIGHPIYRSILQFLKRTSTIILKCLQHASQKKTSIIFYDTPISYEELKNEIERVAGFLQRSLGVKKGDRVILYMQNSPQWIIAFYGILRANAIVVPVNPMNITDELRYYVQDSGAAFAFVAKDIYEQIEPLVRSGEIKHVIVASYGDYIKCPTDLPIPAFLSEERDLVSEKGITLWRDILESDFKPGKLTVGADGLCLIIYTSGTTGRPRGCMHTHQSFMTTTVGTVQWCGHTQDAVFLSVLPFFHVTGLSGSMSGPIYAGATIVLLSRWDRDAAAKIIEKHGVTVWQLISTMMVDFLSNPSVDKYDLSSLICLRGGGAAMPDAIAKKLQELVGLNYLEGYGMSETISATHFNPPQRPKAQCLGIPIFDVDARLIDPDTLNEIKDTNQTGELVIHTPQLMQGYWNNPQDTEEAFIKISNKNFIRTGDLVRIDDEGYFFMVDRLKRMINAAGYKVWPAEVEATMYRHPCILEVCVISTRDKRRGETVKALVVLKDGCQGKVREQDIIDWTRNCLSAYKSPRVVQFLKSLPKSNTGKIQWRKLQEEENNSVV